MVFSSTAFLFFFLPITLLIYFILPRYLKNAFLLIASIFFYMWGEKSYAAIMVASITLNYISGLLIEQFKWKRLFLALAIILNVGLLATFKYLNFATGATSEFLLLIGVEPIRQTSVHLPIGISFFTFQAMSYVIDVYRRVTPAQKNPINMGLYIASFPQLIAGPIIRYRDVAAQIVERTVCREDFAYGITRFILGLGKKVLIANTLAGTADQIFAITTDNLTTSLAWLGIICYTLQIYFDFSGYSDMAIGLGRMFGFRFLENFNYPYISKSMSEFWRRWHISLSNWFRDYLYIPLGGNRHGVGHTYFNLVAVFFLVGLWHGASWSFIAWGLYHGLFLIIERAGFEKVLKKVWWPISHAYTTLIILIGWVLFRTDSLRIAIRYLTTMFGFAGGNKALHHPSLYLNYEVIIALVVGIVLSMPSVPFMKKLTVTALDKNRSNALFGLIESSTIIVLLIILIASAMRIIAGSYNPFIYFRF